MDEDKLIQAAGNFAAWETINSSDPNNKSDMTNEHNFKVGDKVATDDAEYSGIVTAVDDMGCKVRFADGEELFFLNGILHHSDLSDYDRRTAFLTRLQSLLKEFDAKIYGGLSDICSDEEVLYIQIGLDRIEYRNGQYNVCYPHIAADNIMDFDKE